MNRLHLTGLAVVVGLSLSACGTINDYRSPRVDFNTPPVQPVQAVAVAPANGAIYQAATYRPLFEDHRARLPGDVLNIAIMERISASQKSTSSVERSGNLSGSVTALPGVAAGAFARAGVGGSSSNTHDGKGATESSNDFTGSITAVVTGVLPNGHLLITCEKQIGLNANVDVLRFSGQVDPRAILPGNTVPSTAVANVRLEQRSRGQAGDAQVMGLLGRIFMSVMPI